MLRQMGAQAVGMSTVLEVITAVQCRLRILGISVISNVNRPDCQEPASLKAIIATARKAEPRLMALVEGVVSKLTPRELKGGEDQRSEIRNKFKWLKFRNLKRLCFGYSGF